MHDDLYRLVEWVQLQECTKRPIHMSAIEVQAVISHGHFPTMEAARGYAERNGLGEEVDKFAVDDVLTRTPKHVLSTEPIIGYYLVRERVFTRDDLVGFAVGPQVGLTQ